MRKVVFICDKCGKEKEWNNQCKQIGSLELCQECHETYKQDLKKRDDDIQTIVKESERMVKEIQDKFSKKWKAETEKIATLKKNTLSSSAGDDPKFERVNGDFDGDWSNALREIFQILFQD